VPGELVARGAGEKGKERKAVSYSPDFPASTQRKDLETGGFLSENEKGKKKKKEAAMTSTLGGRGKGKVSQKRTITNPLSDSEREEGKKKKERQGAIRRVIAREKERGKTALFCPSVLDIDIRP